MVKSERWGLMRISIKLPLVAWSQVVVGKSEKTLQIQQNQRNV